MVSSQPHFLLFSRADVANVSSGRWHFVLESTEGETVVEAADEEPGLRKERLELLAVVRGLEALDQPSRVTLVTPSRRISRGFRDGLDEWRSNQWRWERDGRWFPIKNRDLWQRVDRALQYHDVECRTWRFDSAHLPAPAAAAAPAAAPAPSPNQGSDSHPSSVRERVALAWPQLRQRLGDAVRPMLAWPTQIGHWGAAT